MEGVITDKNNHIKIDISLFIISIENGGDTEILTQ